MNNRWGYVVILVVFIGISWIVRVLLSQSVSGKVMGREEEKEEKRRRKNSGDSSA